MHCLLLPLVILGFQKERYERWKAEYEVNSFIRGIEKGIYMHCLDKIDYDKGTFQLIIYDPKKNENHTLNDIQKKIFEERFIYKIPCYQEMQKKIILCRSELLKILYIYHESCFQKANKAKNCEDKRKIQEQAYTNPPPQIIFSYLQLKKIEHEEALARWSTYGKPWTEKEEEEQAQRIQHHTLHTCRMEKVRNPLL